MNWILARSEETSSERVAPDGVLHLANAFRGAKVLMSAVELGVFTELAGGPLSLETLRRHIDIHERGTRDFLDALAAMGLLVRDAHGRYANTPEADRYLVEGSSSYIGGWFEHLGAHEYPNWHLLTKALQTGEPQIASDSLYSHLYMESDQVAAFARAMSGATVLVARELATAFRWRDYGTFVDVGSAEGCLPVEVARRHPHLVGVGFDLPPLREVFERNVSRNGLASRLRFQGGNFLSDELPEGDVLVLGRVLHNWNLKKKKLLLRKARAAVRPGGAVIVYERFINDSRSNAAGLLASLNMLVMTSGGFDYSAADCIQWMAEAGFKDMALTSVTADQSMLVGLT